MKKPFEVKFPLQEICRTNHQHFKDMANLRTVAIGCLRGLDKLCQAGVVHCDMKAGKSWGHHGRGGNVRSISIYIYDYIYRYYT